MMGTSGGFETVADLVAWLRRAPAGTRLDAAVVAEILADAGVHGAPDGPESPQAAPDTSEPLTWRERLWTVPAKTRLGVVEAAEALGRPKSYVYAHTGSAEDAIPHRKLDGALVFTAGELRQWIEEREDVVRSVPPSRRIGVVR